MVEQKILKIKTGELFFEGKSHDVFVTAWEKTSKKGVKYFEIRTPVFQQTITKEEVEETKM
ncbi:unnamed protein product [marine sediment metagenome]|uniref:Uncharacterized protein n=1 Tax=marine sediment metagenome TaxID=412755 RepID=X1B603_9ZZZZ